MTFLNPALLWGLAALAVPIIVHFFNLQRPKQVLFSNVAFVREVKKSVVRRLKLRQWLLLLARLLAVSCLVLAFANPVITTAGKAAIQGNRSIAIVLDNSYSMTAGNEKGGYFQQALSLARNLLQSYSKQDEFLVMTTSDIKLNYNFGSQDEAVEGVRELKTKQNIRSQADILGFLDPLFSRANNGFKEIYFLSDFQTATVMADSQVITLQDTSIRIKYIPFASRAQKNVYVASHEILSRITEKGKPVRMSMTIVNDSDNPIKELGINVSLEGKVVAIANHSLEPNTTKEVEITFTPAESGWLSGFIEIDDYPIEYDNRRFFSMYVPEQEKVLVVEGERSPNLHILYEELFTQFESDFVTIKNVSGVQFGDYRSVILLGLNEFSSGLEARVKTFLDEGGSLMFFPATGAPLGEMNNFLNGLGIGSLEAVQTIQDGMQANKVDLDHPIFEGIFSVSGQNREFDAPTVFRYHPIKLSGGAIHNRILSLENQAPILIESRVGKGVVYTFTIFPGGKWTDFHVKTAFAPVMFRATQIMNQTQNVSSGQEIGFFQPHSVRTSQKDLIYLKGDNDLELIPEQYVRSGATVLDFSRLDLKEGNFRIVQGEKELERISFNIPDPESRLAFTPMDELKTQLKQAGLVNIDVLPPQTEALARKIQVEKEGVPLWKYFIILSLFFLLFEILLLRLKK